MRTHSKTCLVPAPDVEGVVILPGLTRATEFGDLVGVTGAAEDTDLVVLVGAEGATGKVALVDFVEETGAAAAVLEAAADALLVLDVLVLPGLVDTFSTFTSMLCSSPFFPPFFTLGLTVGLDVEGTSTSIVASSDSGVTSSVCCEALRARFLVVSGTAVGVGLASALRFRAASLAASLRAVSGQSGPGLQSLCSK